MSAFIPNTRVTVLSGDAVDEFGDPVDMSLIGPVYPAAVTEGTGSTTATTPWQHRFRPAEGRTTVIETFTIRLRPDARVSEGDRLRDDAGVIYQVQDVKNPWSVVGMADVRVTATRVSGASRPVNG